MHSLHRYLSFSLCVCLAPMNCAFVRSVEAQEPAGSETIIRTETRLVLVDAVAVDKKNQFVRDLTQKNFRLWEDGKEQKVTSFSLESSGISPERSNKHYIAMLFDTSTAGQTSQVVVRQEATKFVDGFASADRYMAVVNYANGLQITQNFTADAERLKKALGQVQSTAVNNVGLVRDGARSTGTSTLAMSVDTSPYRNLLASLRGLAGSLATIKGRKALVLFSGGANMTSDITPDVVATIDACNKANVAVYTVGAASSTRSTASADTVPTTQPNRRINAAAVNDATAATANDQNLLSVLSDGTGGLAFATTNDLANSLGKVAVEQDQYYLLGYTPSVDSAEGTCHELNVKVDRGDLEVRARKGYCTTKPVDPLSGKPAGQALEARAAGGAGGNITAKMQLPWFYEAPNVAQVDLAMDITPTAMKFQKDKGKLHGEFDMAGVAYKPDGSVAARFSDTVKLDFDTQKQADDFLKAPYHYENQFHIGPGTYNFRVAFSSDSSGPQGFGKVDMPLVVDPWNGQTLGESGLALSRDTHPVADLASGLDASLLEGQRSLISKGTEAVPTGTSQFQKGEVAFVYFEAYEPLLAAVTKPDAALPLVAARVRVLDRATGQQKVDGGVKLVQSFMHPGNPVVPIISALPTSNLPAGAYRLEVTVMRQTGDPVVRTVDFGIQ
jgi:VWFA-related protein